MYMYMYRTVTDLLEVSCKPMHVLEGEREVCDHIACAACELNHPPQ